MSELDRPYLANGHRRVERPDAQVPYGTIKRVFNVIRGAILCRCSRFSAMQPSVGNPGLRH